MDIIILYIFFYSFHIFQLFDVECFGFLKAVYKKKIKKIMQMHFMHIIKNDFFPTFKQIFFVSMDEKNIQTKFQVINFMLYNLKIIINTLDFRFKTFTLLNFYPTNIASTNPIMPKTAKNAI